MLHENLRKRIFQTPSKAKNMIDLQGTESSSTTQNLKPI